MLVHAWFKRKKLYYMLLNERRVNSSIKWYNKLKLIILLRDYIDVNDYENRLMHELDRYLNYMGYNNKDQVYINKKFSFFNFYKLF